LLPAWDAGTYPFVLQRFSEPVGVISAIPEQPVDLWQAAQQRSRADVIADLTRGNELRVLSTVSGDVLMVIGSA